MRENGCQMFSTRRFVDRNVRIAPATAGRAFETFTRKLGKSEKEKPN